MIVIIHVVELLDGGGSKISKDTFVDSGIGS